MTNHGAGLNLALNIYTPKWFEMSFDNFRSSRHCRVIWQNNDKLGAHLFVLSDPHSATTSRQVQAWVRRLHINEAYR